MYPEQTVTSSYPRRLPHQVPSKPLRSRRPYLRDRGTFRFFSVGGLVSFCLAAVLWVELHIVGRLFLPELMLLMLLPLLLFKRGAKLRSALPLRFLVLGCLWLVAQIVTDIVRETPAADYLRGWAKIGFTLINFAALYLYLSKDEVRFVMFAAGMVVGNIAEYLFAPNRYAEGFPWKFGYGWAVTLAIVLVAQAARSKDHDILSKSLIFGAAALNLILGFRSLSLICFASGAFIFITQRSEASGAGRRAAALRKAFIAAAVIGIPIAGFSVLYSVGSQRGWFGKETALMYQVQSSGDLGFIVGGRSQILASSQAIIDSPLLGHGSWAKDPKYTELLSQRLESYGYALLGEDDEDLIPSHSYVLGAWVESGVIGALFWLWVGLTVIRLMVRMKWSQSTHGLFPLAAFGGMTLVWSIPFSPYGAQERLYASYYIALLMFMGLRRNFRLREVEFVSE